MANLDYTIASGIRPIQLESPQNQLAQAYQLKNLQENSQMNALKMQEMQRGVEQKNRLRTALSGVDINSPEANKLIEQAYLQEGDFGGLMAHRKSMAEMNKEQLGQEKTGLEVANAHFAQAHDLISKMDPNNPTTITALKEITKKLYTIPSTSKVLSAFGSTPETAIKTIDDAVASGKFMDIYERAKSSAKDYALADPARIKASIDLFNQQYGEYVDTMARLKLPPVSQADYRKAMTQQQPNAPAAPPVAAPAAPPVAEAAPPVAEAAPRQSEIGNALVTAAPRPSIDTINYSAMPPAKAAPESAVVTPVVAPSATITKPAVETSTVKMVDTPAGRLPVSTLPGIEGIDATVDTLLSSNNPQLKAKGEALQQVKLAEKRNEDKQSDIAQLQADKAKAIERGDKKAARELQTQIDKRNKIDENAPAINPADLALVYKAINDGRLDPSKVNSRNISIIAGTLAANPTANLKEMAIDSASAMAASKSLAVITANVLSASNEADNMIRIIRKYNPLVSRGQYPDLNAIQVAVDKKTGGTDIVALNTAINGAINAYARAINPKGVATVKDKEHAREILNSAYSKGQLDTILNVMQEEMDAAKRSPGEAAAILKALRRPQSSGGGAVDAAKRKTLTELLK